MLYELSVVTGLAALAMAFDLKKEEDVKEFLDNLGIEYRFGCFSEKRADSKYV